MADWAFCLYSYYSQAEEMIGQVFWSLTAPGFLQRRT
jgi:hypothetical protein